MIVPVGRLTFQFLSAVSTSLMPICRAASACGSICTCTAYFCAPSTCTCATPGDHRNALRDARLGVFVERPQRQRGRGQREVEDRLIGRIDLGEGGRRRHARAAAGATAWVMAACTSTAAPSSLRLRSNSSVIWVLPSELIEVIELQAGDGRELVFERRGHGGRPWSRDWRPGRLAVTSSVGKSTFGRSLTGSER